MWVIYAFLSAFFAGITSILSKCGIKNTDSNLATVLRTIVVLFFSFLMTMIVGSTKQIVNVDSHTWLFLILSGLATGGSWLCYFRALQLGDINKVVPIDKSSVILTMILAFIFLNEPISLLKIVCLILIGVGTYMMIQKKESNTISQKGWFFYALLSAIFASLTSILGKIGIHNVESNLGTTIRTFVVLIMAIIVVYVSKKEIKIYKDELMMIILSGIATGCSWLFYYKALQDGLASVVVPIDKLSILVTISFSYIVFKEKLDKKSLVGLILIVLGTLLMIL